MADETKEPPKSAPIIDVNKPGKIPPSPTSRQIIINHEPTVEDPMVVKSDDATEAGQGITKKADLKIPQSEESKAEDTKEEQEAKETAQNDTPDKAEQEAEPKEEPKDDSKEEPKDKKDLAGDPEAITKAEQEAEEAQAKHDSEIQSLIDSKKYYLPINIVERRRSRQVVLAGILLCLVLGVMWVDVALDAGLVKIGNVKPVTHFFSN